MIEPLIHWLLSAVSFIIVAQFFENFKISSFWTAVLAALVFGIVNATVGFVFTVITLPLSILTFGLFLLVINALMLKLSSLIVPGFEVWGAGTVFFGALILSIVNSLLKWAYAMNPFGF